MFQCVRPVSMDRYKFISDLSSILNMSEEWKIRATQLSDNELLRIAFSITEDTQPNPNLSVFPFRFQKKSLYSYRGVATDCVHIFRKLAAVNVLCDLFDTICKPGTSTRNIVTSATKFIRLSKLVNKAGDLPDELVHPILKPDVQKLCMFFIQLVFSTHVDATIQDQKVLGKSIRTVAYVWQECCEPGPFSSLRQQLIKESKLKLVELYRVAVLHFGGIPGNTIPDNPTELANNWEDCMACGPAKEEFHRQYEVYKLTVRKAPLLISKAIKTNAPPKLDGELHVIDITEQSSDNLVGKKYSFQL